MNPVVDSARLSRSEVWAEDDPAVRWAGAFARCGHVLGAPNRNG